MENRTKKVVVLSNSQLLIEPCGIGTTSPMPCLIIAGHPSAGKTTLAKLLKERALLHDAIDEVVIVNEESECGCDGSVGTEKVAKTKQDLYQTSTAEKQTRGALKAAFDRAVKKSGGGSRKLVILDSMNYIKGFRYELHCISKASGEKHGILWVLNRVSIVEEWNKSYSPELLKELISRFEPPDERNRWDKPLFTVDVAAAADKETAKGKLSSKNEVLENSVYNMHSLGEAFGTTVEPADTPVAAPVSTQTQPLTTTNAAAPASKPRAPKKSAFSRRKKATPAAEKQKSKTVPTAPLNQENKIIFDTSIMTQQNETAISERGNNQKSAPISQPASAQPKDEINTKSVEEQLDDILNTFLLQTQNLKEGMSTRTYD